MENSAIMQPHFDGLEVQVTQRFKSLYTPREQRIEIEKVKNENKRFSLEKLIVSEINSNGNPYHLSMSQS